MILVVGGGPAGLAAARAVVACGRDVTLIDDNPGLGGQIWRGQQIAPEFPVRLRSRVVMAREDAVLLEGPDGAEWLRFSKLILATGARELFLPFPGWTLPGIFGAGGLQAFAKSGLPVRGKRIVVAGTGPLLLAVAAWLRAHGADVRLIAEQTPPASLIGFGRALLQHPAKLRQGAGLAWQLAGVPYATGSWVEAAEPGRLWLRQGDRRWSEPFDYAGIGYGLVPNDELHVPGAIVAGTGDVGLASLEGAAAGYKACDREDLAPDLTKARQFEAALRDAFALRPELKSLASEDTPICRCENVAFGRVSQYETFRAAKLQTRCGMGPCQGRVCGAAGRFLFGWQDTSVRPPLFASRVATLVTPPLVTKVKNQ